MSREETGSETDEAASPALVARPAPDKLARAVARERIASALFAKREPVKLGRYHLLEQVGRGGMGVVWGAFDPELDRRVAIKLVQAELVAARERIQLEGQALAKLSHPNVVPVYDVGVVDEQIYLVMEWVRGQNLRAWSTQPRTVREIVAVYRAAGEGLAAAHHAGVIHRDFKPDNAMIGDDGRVRVLDFGLARSEPRDGGPGDASAGEELTRGAGTPRYMAPEQAQGRQLTTAVDQYAFGVSLREALAGRTGEGTEAEIPGWLAAILTRATAPVPGDRFPSMDALLAALARDPRTVWRRRAVFAGALSLAGAAFALGTVRGGASQPEPCSGAAAELATAWGPDARARVAAHLRGLGPYGANVAAEVERDLDAYAERWARAHRGACLASAAGELPPAVHERTIRCLARARSSLGAATEVLAAVTVDRLPDAVVAAQTLPDAERCRTDSEVSTVAPPPAALAARVDEIANEVARARVLALAMDPRAIELSASAARSADALSYPALAGRAHLVHGQALLLQQHWQEALPALDRATTAAFTAGDGTTGIEALARQLYAHAIAAAGSDEQVPADAERALASLHLAEPIARSLGHGGAFARSLLFNNAGTLLLSREDRAGARAWFERALHERPRATSDAVELAAVPGNLGMVVDDPASRDALMAQEGDELAAVVGDDHPMALDARLKAAMHIAHPERSGARLRDACNRYRRLHPHLVQRIAHCASELLWLAEERGDVAEAREAIAAISPDAALEAPLATGYRLLLDGQQAEAARRMRDLARELQRHDHYWMRWRSVDALIVAALAQPSSVAELERALSTLNEITVIEGATYFQRRLARVRTLLARRGARGALEHARAAAAWYRQAGGYDAIVAELDAIVTASSR